MTISSTKIRTTPHRVVATLAAGALTLGVAAALTVGSDAADAGSGRVYDTYTVAKSGAITGHAAQTPGRKSFRITGHKGEAFQLVRSRHGAGAGTLLADANTLNSSGSPIALERDFELKGGTQVGQTFYASLRAGDYYAIDTNAARPTVKHIHVSGPSSNVSQPANVRIQAVAEESWYGKPKSIPTSGVIQFQNKAAQSHFIELVRMKPGKTNADITEVFQGKEKQGDVFYSGKSDDFGTGVLSPLNTMYTTYSLKAGTWALLCFWPDRKTGMPHAVMGMHRTIEVGHVRSSGATSSPSAPTVGRGGGSAG